LSDEPHGTLLAQTIMRTRALGKVKCMRRKRTPWGVTVYAKATEC